MLIRKLSMRIADGEHTAVVGPNGAGKTSLFRTLGGLWPACEGSAVVPASMYIMPQRAHFAFQASLLEQVCYPIEEGVMVGGRMPLEVRAEVDRLLRQVGLEDVVETRGLDCTDDFHVSLSGGQQQRVMWARMFFVLQRVPAGQPRYALLDEATAAISMDWFSRLYEAAKERGITVVSIAHNVAVEKLHPRRLTLAAEGSWALKSLE